MNELNPFDDIFGEETVDLSIPENLEKLATRSEIFNRNQKIYYENDYPRTVSCKFPYEAARLYNIFYLEFSIRDLLTFFAAKNPDEATRVLQLRDDFYSGDKDDDYFQYSEQSPWTLLEGEERAVAVVARAKERDEREAAQSPHEAESEAAWIKRQNEERERWLPFADERQAIDAEGEALWQRQDLLDDEWERFVRDRETWGEDRQARETATRAELEAKSDQLLRDREAMYARSSELEDRSWREYSRKTKEV